MRERMYYLLMLAFLSFSYSCNETPRQQAIVKDTQWAEDNLRGKVKHLTLYKDSYNLSRPDPINPRMEKKLSYTELGARKQQVSYDESGKQSSEEYWEAKGKEHRYVMKSKPLGIPYETVHTVRTDSFNRVRHELITTNDSMMTRRTNYLDDEYRTIRTVDFDGKDTIKTEIEREFDEEGRIVKETHSIDDQPFIFESLYDVDGNLVSYISKMFGPKRKIISVYLDNVLRERLWYTEIDNVSQDKILGDRNSAEIEAKDSTQVETEYELIKNTIFDHKSNAVRVSENLNTPESYVYFHRYKYDESGNWIKRHTYRYSKTGDKPAKEIPIHVHNRDITYW